MQFSRSDRLSGTPVSTFNRIGLVILAIVCFPPIVILVIFWADAEGFWSRINATALPAIFLGLIFMAINGAVTGRVRFGWLFGPMIFAFAVGLALLLLT